MNTTSNTIGKITREEFRRQKDLEEARKAGNAPAEQDEEGRDINPHIPQFMSQAPWYIDSGKPSLNHQRVTKSSIERGPWNTDVWGLKGARVGPAAKTFRKGACENCGAMSHKTKECLERPRKQGAKYSGRDIQADEAVLDLGQRDYDAKRDRYNGYDPKEYKDVYDQYERVEQARRKLREEQLDREALEAATRVSEAPAEKISSEEPKKRKRKEGVMEDEEFGDFGSSEDEDDQEEEKYAETADMPGQKVSGRQTQRNLRIREDKSKYLLDLGADAPYYDPKSRSLRENPNAPPVNPDGVYVSENFQRASGESHEIARMQVFAWEAEQRGSDLSLQANPTQAALAHKDNLMAKQSQKQSTTQTILEKYGGSEHLVRPPKELIMSQSTNYVEYDRSGKIVKGQERLAVSSRFEEDVYPNNHTSVWGSWYSKEDRKWGYDCCHSIIKNSYCAGEAGKAATEASSRVILDKLEQPGEEDREDQEFERPQSIAKSIDVNKARHNGSYRKPGGDEMTEEDLESFRRKRHHFEDPMADFKNVPL